GEPALSAARRVGGEGSVIASDLVPEMLATARRRAHEAGLANVSFEIADMERLPFPDERFDRLTCRFGIMFAPEPRRVLEQSLRVLAPGGRAGFMAWGPIEETTMFRVIRDAERAVFGGEADLDTPFRFARPGELGEAMTAAGFVAVDERELRFESRVAAERPFWHAMRDMSLGPHLARADERRREALERALDQGFAACRDGESYRLAALVRLAAGGRPHRR
ncbi:MAG: class I SAM-dependent methyltransferase, partial [Alphaproteobacteria bacterium]